MARGYAACPSVVACSGRPSERSRLAEEAPRRARVARRAQPRVDQVPRTVDRAVAVTPAAIDPDIRRSRVPLRARRTAPSGPRLRGEERGEARLPVAHRLVREGEAALQEHPGHIPQAAFVTHAPQHHEQGDVRRSLHLNKRRAGALVSDPAAAGAAAGAIAQRHPPGRFGRGRHGAVGARPCLLRESRHPRNATSGRPAPPGASSEI